MGKGEKRNRGLYTGIFIIIVGVVSFVDNFIEINWSYIWPLLLIVLGIIIIKDVD